MEEIKELFVHAIAEKLLKRRKATSPKFWLGHIVGRLKMALSNINAVQRKVTDEDLDEKLRVAKEHVEEVLREVRRHLKELD